ncbi:hypothetical protein INT45_005286 [Circinella minor]|uniref:Reverse transcriptase domain-containing protein n=1 Tax=Circinella minor TaxID=1195481 RepID=A0A8H7S8J7_9FUNG|nr:hypothetical protein INT45_005286 [Circinella minor]
MLIIYKPPFSLDDFPLPQEDIIAALKRLPTKKAPSADHLRGEMIKPIVELIALILLGLFRLCWKWGATPSAWSLAQVVPIYKKGDLANPGNYRPISLISIMRKIFEMCIQEPLADLGPQLDIAQASFRHHHSSLNQALCLREISNLHISLYGEQPILAFLDVKSVYNAVDRNIVWNALYSLIPPAFITLLKNLFDEVSIELLLSGAISHSIHPVTGVLQGSVLSPYLYSIYINSLPSLLRDVETTFDTDNTYDDPFDLPPPQLLINKQKINCLLYADDVALIGTATTLPLLLEACEMHSYDLGYRWNPAKCVIMMSHTSDQSFYLYGEEIPQAPTFKYLGIPFDNTGNIDPTRLIQQNSSSALAVMRVFRSIGVNPTAITWFSDKQTKLLEEAQNNCLHLIFVAHKTFSTKVIRHITRLPAMAERISILQTKLLVRAYDLPSDTLLHQL